MQVFGDAVRSKYPVWAEWGGGLWVAQTDTTG